ncbi:hypothetical protein K8B33_05420 [Alcanivorax sp. JB21]|uniref:hypothetical protein n=1 Tax=Alcanivorax limicola TaxID=2874102 RepID=UPI001CBBFCA3|nr:hypothetical protein [Alcanivorax limicola]MBZ2188524.1 hypothetical protein [Alcanivorax limicola]
MKIKLAISTLLGIAAWSLSSMAMAWDTGPCPSPGGPAPCIEAVVGGNTYHFNGSGAYADVWKGLPTTGADFQFSGPTELGCGSLDLDCTLTLGGKVKKCQDSSGAWRIGVQVNSSNVSGGFPCGTVVLGNFEWLAKDPTITSHCPFTDTCDNFIPYDPNASDYTANFGEIDITVLFIPRVRDGHVHGVVFTPGAGANFAFNSQFYDCDENDLGCSVEGVLTLTNATSLDIH